MFQESIKKSFECPITRLIIKRPVIAADGHTYDQGAIEEWFENKKTSPLTGEPMANTNLIPNHHLKSQIEAFMDAKKKGIAEAIKEIKIQGDVVREYDELYRSDVDKLGKIARMKTKEVGDLNFTIKNMGAIERMLNKQLDVTRKQNEELVEKNEKLFKISMGKNIGCACGLLSKYTIDDVLHGRINWSSLEESIKSINWEKNSLEGRGGYFPSEGEVWDETNPTYTCFDRSTSVKVSKFTGGRVYFQYLPHRGWVDSQPHDLLLEQFLQDYQPKLTPQELEDLPELDGEDDSDFDKVRRKLLSND